MKKIEQYPFSRKEDFIFFFIAFGACYALMYLAVYFVDGGDGLGMFMFWLFSALGSTIIAMIGTKNRNK